MGQSGREHRPVCCMFLFVACLLHVPVCCMFFVSQNIHIKRSPNGIKTDRDFFGIYMIFGKKNPRETMLGWPTRQGARPTPLGAPLNLVATP